MKSSKKYFINYLLPLILIALGIWIAKSLIYGQLELLSRQSPVERFDTFVWASSRVVIQNNGFTSIALKGQSPRDQLIELSCSQNPFSLANLKKGFFSSEHRIPADCINKSISINSNFKFIPSNEIGSSDKRELSYQIGFIAFDDQSVSLEEFSRHGSGIYGIEQNFNRISPQEILTSTWDSGWYLKIINFGYKYDGNSAAQQNVAWPFLYPYISKLYMKIFSVNAQDALLYTSTIALFFSLAVIYRIGVTLGLSNTLAYVPCIYLLFNPFGIFLQGGFSESLFICFFAIALLLILRRKWIFASFMIAAMSGTRFVGLIAMFPLLLSFYHEQRLKNQPVKWPTMIIMTFIGISGIVVDILIKYSITTYPFAAFQVRSAWGITPLKEWLSIFNFSTISAGNYLPILLVTGFTILVCGKYAINAYKENHQDKAVLMIAGCMMVLTTFAINPEIHSFGRYSLPLVFALIGALAFKIQSDKSLLLLITLGLSGCLFSGPMAHRFYLQLPPF